MKASQRIKKFREFEKLHLAGQLRSHEIISTLGISKNTLYNWRKRLKIGNAINTSVHSPADTAFPSFTKIIPRSTTVQPSIPHCIEIAIGTSVVIRIPETLQPQSLQQIVAMIVQGDECR
jgi:transposase-like protein